MAKSENENWYENLVFLNVRNILLSAIFLAGIVIYFKFDEVDKKMSERRELLAVLINIKNSYEQSYGPESKYRKDIENMRKYGSAELNMQLNYQDTLLNSKREEYLEAKLSIDSIHILTENNL
jgi:hypothetical protein